MKSLKEDLRYTTTELVYGTTLILPHTFFLAKSFTSDPSSYIADLQCRMNTLKAIPPHLVSNPVADVNTILQEATQMFVLHDVICKPFSHHDDPYKY